MKRYRSVSKLTKVNTLSVYLDKKNGVVKNIVVDDVVAAMKMSAKALYDLSDAELDAFKCHLIRVGACCILFSQGVRPAMIKKLLRWKSDAWLVYLRDLTAIANSQNEAIVSAAELPCL